MERSLSASAEAGTGEVRPVVPRPAATVIVVRDGADGRPETFMVRRDPNSRFAADAFVFPGGAVQADDRLAGGEPPCSGLTIAAAHTRTTERGGDPPDDPGLSLALHLAAVRELYEEAGILLARHAGDLGSAVIRPETCAVLAELRQEIQQGQRRLAEVAAELELELVPEELIPFSHWITPESSPRRFDTRFFMIEDRPGQVASHCGVETIDGVWVTPARALDRHEAGEITLVSVTVDHLRLLDRFGSTAELLAFARTKPIRTVRARMRPEGWDLGGNGAPW
jgi:8-oxo-dGTP pyrophosphatase MutT (NUDIX family)